MIPDMVLSYNIVVFIFQLGSEMLINLHKSFTELMFETGIPLLSFGEGKKSDLPFNFKLMIVPPESSSEYFFGFIFDQHLRPATSDDI